VEQKTREKPYTRNQRRQFFTKVFEKLFSSQVNNPGASLEAFSNQSQIHLSLVQLLVTSLLIPTVLSF